MALLQIQSILCAMLPMLLAATPIEDAWIQEQRKGVPADFEAYHGPHFTLLTNIPADAAKEQLQVLENTFDSFYGELPKLGVLPEKPKERLVCILFRRRDHFRAFHRRAEGVDVPWGTGHYSPRSNRITLYHDLDSPAFAKVRAEIKELEDRIIELQHELENPPPEADDIDKAEMGKKLAEANDARSDRMDRLEFAAREATAWKLRHEAAHQLFYNSGLMMRGRDYPLWLSEGLATLFEPTGANGKIVFAAGNPFRLPTYRSARQRSALLPLAELLSYAPADGDEPGGVTTAYAQAWALATYLRHEKPGALAALVRAAANPAADWPALFRQHAGADLSALASAVDRFIERLEPPAK